MNTAGLLNFTIMGTTRGGGSGAARTARRGSRRTAKRRGSRRTAKRRGSRRTATRRGGRR